MTEYFKLTSETIDMLSEKLSEMYSSCNVGKKEATRARLLLEEALIKYQNNFGSEIEVCYRKYRIFGQQRFIVRIKSASFDPFTLDENPMAFMIESVMSSIENGLPAWQYRNLENELVFTINRKTGRSAISKLAIASIASIAVSVPVRVVFGGKALTGFVNNYINPLSDAYAGMFCIMAVLLTFFAIALSIVGIGDMNAAGVVGGGIIRRFYIMSAALVVVLALPVLPFFEYSSAGDVAVATKSVYEILVGFIPSNLVTPFLNFNTIHIVIIGVMFGFSLLTMGQKGSTTVQLFDECNLVAIITNNFLNKFIAFYVALKLFALITTSDFSELIGAGRLVVTIVLGELIMFAFYTVYVCRRNGIAYSEYLHNMLPFFMVCLSSANFGASFSTIVDGLLGLDAFDDNSKIALNLGSVIFRPALALVFFVSALSMSAMYDVDVSSVWIVTAVILSILLVAAVPNIPGGAVSVIPLFYAQMGLPNEAVSLMIAINAPLQFLTVAVDTWCLAAECVNVSNRNKSGELSTDE